MSDTRAAIRELRSLGEKRSTQGLTDQEQSRLAELRERLGLPSEPAQSRSGGPRPGGASSATPPPAAVPVPQPSAATATLQGLEVPVGPAALPSFAPVPAPEPDAPALVPVSLRPGVAPDPAAGHEGDSTEQPLPALEAAVLGAMVQGTAPAPAETPADLPPEPFDSGTPEGDAGVEALPELTAEGLSLTNEGAPLDALPEFAAYPLVPAADDGALGALPELAAEDLSPPTDGTALGALPELAAEDLSPPTDGAALDALPELAADLLETAMPGEAAGQEPSGTLPDLAATGSIELLAEAPGPESPPEDLSPPVAPPRTSLADRIDAAVETLESEATQGEEQPGWGAVPVAAESTEAGLPLESELQADLGAIPLDVADPAIDPGFRRHGRCHRAVLGRRDCARRRAQQEPDLGGEPADPVPLAALHEFVGEQPLDPRALAFDDQEDEPTLVPEDLRRPGPSWRARRTRFIHAGRREPATGTACPAGPRCTPRRRPAAAARPTAGACPRPIPLTVESPPAPAPVTAAPAFRRTATSPPRPAPPRYRR